MKNNNLNGQPKKNTSLGTAGMVLGIVSLVLSCLIIGGLVGIAGFIISIVAIIGKETPKGKAVAGIVLNSIALVIAGGVLLIAVLSPDESKTDKNTTVVSESTEKPQKNKNKSKTSDKKNKTEKPEDKSDYVSNFSIPKNKIYTGHGVSVSINDVEKTSEYISIEFVCLNNSKKDCSVYVDSYAVNNLMTGQWSWYAGADIPSGKKNKFHISIEKEWFIENNIINFKKLDIVFSISNDEYNTEKTEVLTIRTSSDNGKGYYVPKGKEIYSDKNMSVYYISSNSNSYKMCLKNKKQKSYEWILDDCSVNDWGYDLGSVKYDLYDEPILNECYSIFEIKVDDDFMEKYEIKNIKNIEFRIEFDYTEIKSEKIKLNQNS